MQHPNRRSFLHGLGATLASWWPALIGCSTQHHGFMNSSTTHGARAGGADASATTAAGTSARATHPPRSDAGSAADSATPGASVSNSDDDAGAAARKPDVEIVLRAVQTQAQLLPGKLSNIWTLRGELLHGPAAALQTLPSGALGPTIRLRRGQRLRITLDNQLSEDTVLHWHGLLVPANMDGHPRFAIAPNEQYVYDFEVRNRAGTYFYHAHPDGRTGAQVYRGMAGLLIVDDDERDALPLPSGAYDVPLVLQDRVFDTDNQLIYQPTLHDMGGWLGERVLVNGKSDYVMSAATRPYLLRILNASNARVYRIAFEDASALTVIGTDGGLLERPVQRDYVMLAPGERVELWADFSGRRLGSELQLVSLGFAAHSGPNHPSATNVASAQGAQMPIMRLRFDKASSEHEPLPARLSSFDHVRPSDATNTSSPRRIVLAMQHMRWTLNGRVFQLEEVADDERVKLDALEIWEFDNASSIGGGMMHGAAMMRAPHPMHLHGGQFQVLGRTGVEHAGYVDGGFKDTVLVMPGETAKIAMRFEKYAGLFLYHCHNLEHEDRGMMRNLEVYA